MPFQVGLIKINIVHALQSYINYVSFLISLLHSKEYNYVTLCSRIFVIAIIAALLGFGGIAGSATEIAKILFLSF